MIQRIENKPSANLIISEYSVQTTGNALKKNGQRVKSLEN